jgi:hypothetical protein
MILILILLLDDSRTDKDYLALLNNAININPQNVILMYYYNTLILLYKKIYLIIRFQLNLHRNLIHFW